MRVAINGLGRNGREYGKMFKEHDAMKQAMPQLVAAARDEDPQQTAFAESLILYAQNEEQALYPATLVIGDSLKLQRASRRGKE